MKKKTNVEVVINNKKYIICGYESPDYMEKIASHINKKINSLKSEDWYKQLDMDIKSVLLDINLCDDYFKVVEQVNELQDQQNRANNDLYEIKHEAVEKQTQIEALQKRYNELDVKYQEAQKKIIELNAQLAMSESK